MEGEEEAVVACSDKSMKIGIKIWDLQSGDTLPHIPTCASPPLGFLSLRNRFLVGSQVNKHGSVGGGSIVVWPFCKPQYPILNYTTEAVGPLSCTKDGIYLVGGGALSGTAYIWEVTSGKLLKTWRAHHKSIKCLLFSDDNSFLISGCDDGMICVWSMISLLDVEETRSSHSLLHHLPGHTSSITGLVIASGFFTVLISSSFDGTCKVWDFISGRLIQTQDYTSAITSITLHQGILFCGAENGKIIANELDIGLVEGPTVITDDQPLELKGHNGAITALASSQSGLISASVDCTICVWDVDSQTIIRRFDLQKGRVTNLVVVPRSSVLSTSNVRRVFNSNQYNVSPLEKYPPQINSLKANTTLLSLCGHYKEKKAFTGSRISSFLRQHMSGSQKTAMPTVTSIQMKMETGMESRVWAINMAKHIMAINRQLQSQLTDMMQRKLLPSNASNSQKTSRVKKPKTQSLENAQEEENEKS